MSDEPKRLIPLAPPPGWGMVVIQNHTDTDNPDPPIIKYFKPPTDAPPPQTGFGVPVVHIVNNPTET